MNNTIKSISESLHFEKIAEILNNIGERIEGNLICDIHSENIVVERNRPKILNLQNLTEGKKKICEIGFNAGHSLLLMLEKNPTAEYLIFDLNAHSYTEPCLEYIKSVYPDTKIEVVFGDSTHTINDFLEKNPDKINTFDFIHIDGGHSLHLVVSDFHSCKRLSSENGIVIFDDYDWDGIGTFLEVKKLEKELEVVTKNPYNDLNLIPTNLHFIYKYTN
jgi:predicted O-methyltransferase YrrM